MILDALLESRRRSQLLGYILITTLGDLFCHPFASMNVFLGPTVLMYRYIHILIFHICYFRPLTYFTCLIFTHTKFLFTIFIFLMCRLKNISRFLIFYSDSEHYADLYFKCRSSRKPCLGPIGFFQKVLKEKS